MSDEVTESVSTEETQVVTEATPEVPQVDSTPALQEGQEAKEVPNVPSQAEQLRAAYSLEPQEEEGEQAAEAETQEEEKPYALEFSEGTVIDEGLVGFSTQHAKELGIDGKVAGSFVERVMASWQEAEVANMVKTDAELKQDWGADYDANVREVRKFAEAARVKSGLTAQDTALLQSPKGYRLIYAMMKASGSVDTPAAGAGKDSGAGDIAWANAVLNDPTHPDYMKLRDTSDRKAFEETRARLYKIKAANKL